MELLLLLRQGLYDLRWGRFVRAGTMPGYIATSFFTKAGRAKQALCKDRKDTAQDQEIFLTGLSECTLYTVPALESIKAFFKILVAACTLGYRIMWVLPLVKVLKFYYRSVCKMKQANRWKYEDIELCEKHFWCFVDSVDIETFPEHIIHFPTHVTLLHMF